MIHQLIKAYLRPTMNQIRLSNLAILLIERNVAETITFHLVNEFATKGKKINL